MCKLRELFIWMQGLVTLNYHMPSILVHPCMKSRMIVGSRSLWCLGLKQQMEGNIVSRRYLHPEILSTAQLQIMLKTLGIHGTSGRFPSDTASEFVKVLAPNWVDMIVQYAVCVSSTQKTRAYITYGFMALPLVREPIHFQLYPTRYQSVRCNAILTFLAND